MRLLCVGALMFVCFGCSSPDSGVDQTEAIQELRNETELLKAQLAASEAQNVVNLEARVAYLERELGLSDDGPLRSLLNIQAKIQEFDKVRQLAEMNKRRIENKGVDMSKFSFGSGKK